jgi:hypothetical protein
MSSVPAPTREGVLVYCYYTYLAAGGNVVPVHSSRPATLDLIESLNAVPVLQSAREANPSEVCELGFFRGASHCGHVERRAQAI